MSIADKILRLQNAKTAIASAITAKGGTVATGDGFEDFPEVIASIPSGGGGGHKIYVKFKPYPSPETGVYITVNGSETYDLCVWEPIMGEYSNGYAWENLSDISSICISGSDYWRERSYAQGYTSARMKSHTGNTWTWLSQNVTYDITEDTDLEICTGTCLNKGTLITMFDWSKKPVEDIEIGDIVRDYKGSPLVVYRSEKGCRNFADERDIWNFEGGYQIITAYRHQFYNVEHQKMMYLYEWEIGEHAYAEDGNKVALLEHIHEDTPCKFYSLWCGEKGVSGNNYFAGGLLSGNRFTEEIKID